MTYRSSKSFAVGGETRPGLVRRLLCRIGRTPEVELDPRQIRLVTGGEPVTARTLDDRQRRPIP